MLQWYFTKETDGSFKEAKCFTEMRFFFLLKALKFQILNIKALEQWRETQYLLFVPQWTQFLFSMEPARIFNDI